MPDANDVHVDFYHASHYTNAEEPYFVVSFTLYLFGLEDTSVDIDVTVPDSGQSSGQFLQDACDLLAERLGRAQEILRAKKSAIPGESNE